MRAAKLDGLSSGVPRELISISRNFVVFFGKYREASRSELSCSCVLVGVACGVALRGTKPTQAQLAKINHFRFGH